MSWNAAPPRGGPMVAVDGFPGPLYPPDAAPAKTPSSDSPFVVAVKRTAARCGAWPWDPDGWDDSYSNRFAHGEGWGHPTHAGVEGLQHWAGTIDPISGWVGHSFFNFLRSVRVPQGRTHAGEPAMDSVAAALVNQAYLEAHPPAPQTTAREQALELALSQVGVTESPAGSNIVKYSEWYGMVGPWCAMFVTWVYDGPDHRAPGSSSFHASNGRYAYVPYIVADARGGRYGLSITSSPKPGDLVCFDWEGNGEFDHVGLFELWTAKDQGAFRTCEGNTSPDEGGSQSNGGGVYRRDRNVRSASLAFVRVAE